MAEDTPIHKVLAGRPQFPFRNPRSTWICARIDAACVPFLNKPICINGHCNIQHKHFFKNKLSCKTLQIDT